MFITSADLNDTYAIEGRNLERRASLGAFIRIETALASMIVSTTNYIAFTCQEQGVRPSAAYLNNLLFEYVKSL